MLLVLLLAAPLVLLLAALALLLALVVRPLALALALPLALARPLALTAALTAASTGLHAFAQPRQRAPRSGHSGQKTRGASAGCRSSLGHVEKP